MKPYKDNVTLSYIIKDGWSRGFRPEQTISEAKEMGFELSLDELLQEWEKYSKQYEEFYSKQYEEFLKESGAQLALEEIYDYFKP